MDAFDDKQQQEIRRILLKYGEDKEYRNNLLEKYSTSTYELTILELYVVEEILEIGYKYIYRNYIRTNDSEDFYFYDKFMKKIMRDGEYFSEKLRSLKTLPPIQRFVIGVVLKNVVEQNHIEIYDPYNIISNESEQETITSLKNLYLGRAILSIVDNCPDKTVFKQRARGQFSSVSKEKLINILREIRPDVEDMVERQVEKFLNPLKLLDPEDRKNSIIFVDVNWESGYTNISFEEVYGKSKTNVKD